jgi:hypothetical protein
MPATGQDLGADLHYLYVAATRDLPVLADVFADASKALATAGDGDQYWTFPPMFSGKMRNIHQSWLDMRSTIKRFLDDTHGSLHDTARTLILAIDAYASQDAEAKAEMKRLNKNNGPYQPV